jgi:hypothetical protein
MHPITRAKLNSLRRPLLTIAVQQQQLPKHDANIAYSSGLGEAFDQRRQRKVAARAKTKAARASRKRNRR